MLQKQIVYFGKAAVVSCDGNCRKAWGISIRPKIEFDANDPDDCAFLADGELGDAPARPGTYEGGQTKPRNESERLHSRWCTRECERSNLSDVGEPVVLRDLTKRLFNQPWKHNPPGDQ